MRCFVHPGASYQFSPLTISNRPSRFTSVTVAASFAPGSMRCFWNMGQRGASLVEIMVAEVRSSAANNVAVQNFLMDSPVMLEKMDNERSVRGAHYAASFVIPTEAGIQGLHPFPGFRLSPE